MTQHRILESLQIERFRAFRQLRIERLGQVNLITGKNNVGKSCLLEALRLYANRGSLLTMRALLDAGDENIHLDTDESGQTVEQGIRHLFYGRAHLERQKNAIEIGPIDSIEKTLKASIVWFAEYVEHGQRHLRLLESNDEEIIARRPGVGTYLGGKRILTFPLDQETLDVRFVTPESDMIKNAFVPARGLDDKTISQLWDKITLTDLEQDVIMALRIIDADVERINFVEQRKGKGARIPIVRTSRLDVPIPLRSLGEGMNRLFSIILALVDAREGVLLIDEVENGLHYSVQQNLWHLIFQVAQRLNVQVFATTHSWDCIAAFQRAIQKDEQGDGLLINLREKKNEPGDVIAVLFDKAELAIVTRENIEVR